MADRDNKQIETKNSEPSTSSSIGTKRSAYKQVGDSWLVMERIGKGSFATVWKGHHKLTFKEVAIKHVSRDKLNKKLAENLETEINILQQLRHPNVVRLYEIQKTQRSIYLIMEYCKGGDLSKFIKKNGKQSEEISRYFIKQLASGLEYCRGLSLIHRDLKPQNLLLDSESPNATLKIADFGFARVIQPNDMAETLCGSPLYMAPEILKYKPYDASVDLWSVGAIMYELLVGRPPFQAENHIQLLKVIENSTFKLPSDLKISNEALDLLTGLLKRNPTDRMSFSDFFMHPWLSMERFPIKIATLLPSNQIPEGKLQQALNKKNENLESEKKRNYERKSPTSQISYDPPAVPIRRSISNGSNLQIAGSPGGSGSTLVPRAVSTPKFNPFKEPQHDFTTIGGLSPPNILGSSPIGKQAAAFLSTSPSEDYVVVGKEASASVLWGSAGRTSNVINFRNRLNSSPASSTILNSATHRESGVNTRTMVRTRSSSTSDVTHDDNTNNFNTTILLRKLYSNENFDEDMLLQMINLIGNRAYKIGQVGAYYEKENRPAEASCVYVKACTELRLCLEKSKSSIVVLKLSVSQKLKSNLQWIYSRFSQYLSKAELLKQDSTKYFLNEQILESSVDLLYNHAIAMGKLASIEEMNHNTSAAIAYYHSARDILNLLLEESIDHNETIKSYLDRFSNRANILLYSLQS